MSHSYIDVVRTYDWFMEVFLEGFTLLGLEEKLVRMCEENKR
jgi:hypothetical protein